MPLIWSGDSYLVRFHTEQIYIVILPSFGVDAHDLRAMLGKLNDVGALRYVERGEVAIVQRYSDRRQWVGSIGAER